GDLGSLLVDQVSAAGLRELVDGITPLLDQGGDDLQHLRVLEIAALLNHALVHDRSLQHPQRRQAGGVLRLHRGGHISGNLFVQRHLLVHLLFTSYFSLVTFKYQWSWSESPYVMCQPLVSS